MITLVGMIGVSVMFYLDWRFTLIALSVAPVLFLVVYTYTRRIKKASREVRKKEGEVFLVIEEVLFSIRAVKAFAPEDYELRRLEKESLESVEIGLRAAWDLKGKQDVQTHAGALENYGYVFESDGGYERSRKFCKPIRKLRIFPRRGLPRNSKKRSNSSVNLCYRCGPGAPHGLELPYRL
jgi:hypothetical protein